MKRMIDHRRDKRRRGLVYLLRALAIIAIIGTLVNIFKEDQDIISAYSCIALAGLSLIVSGYPEFLTSRRRSGLTWNCHPLIRSVTWKQNGHASGGAACVVGMINPFSTSNYFIKYKHFSKLFDITLYFVRK